MQRLHAGRHFTLVLLALGALAQPARSQAPTGIESLSLQKDAYAAALAAQIALCSSRIDTNHATFRGCVDWHSAVHGVWALVAYERATGQRRYAPLVARVLAQNALESERIELQRRPAFEMPYGRAWFLRLAIDHRKLTRNGLLQNMADEVAISLRDHFRSAGVAQNSTSYKSASWAMINLLDYARERNLGELAAEIESTVKKEFVTPDPRCPLQAEDGHFMAICTNRAALVSRVLDRQQYLAWLDAFIHVNGLPNPITPSTAHTYGLNFSRAWGLWDMYAKSGRPDVGDAYARHFKRGYTPETNWHGDYQLVGHWVAQFGVFALQPLFGPPSGR